MMKVTKVDEAAYISAVTGEMASVGISDTRTVYFLFSTSDENIRAHNGYGKEILLDDGNLVVDLSSYLRHIRHYNKKMLEIYRNN